MVGACRKLIFSRRLGLDNHHCCDRKKENVSSNRHADRACVRCLQVTTEKMIRKQLEEQLGIDLGDRKAFIRDQVCLPQQ